jgi:methionyl-tRNA formyltransferase
MQDIIVFLNGQRGLEVVTELKKSGHRILKCVIPLNKNYNKLEKEIKKKNIGCLRFENVNSNNAILEFKKLNSKLFIIAGYSTIFKEELIKLPSKGTINLHAGRLPEYRGGSPLNWQLINGDKRATISIVRVDKEIDAGNVLGEKDIIIKKSTDIKDLHNQANKLFPQLVKNIIDKIENLKGRIQNKKKSIYWHQRNDNDGHIDFKKINAYQASRLVRALTKPYPGAWANLERKRVRIFKIEIPQFNICGKPGRICFIQKQGPYVICKDKAILIKDYIIQGNSETKLKNGQYLT